jgi:hypothetical protein
MPAFPTRRKKASLVPSLPFPPPSTPPTSSPAPRWHRPSTPASRPFALLHPLFNSSTSPVSSSIRRIRGASDLSIATPSTRQTFSAFPGHFSFLSPTLTSSSARSLTWETTLDFWCKEIPPLHAFLPSHPQDVARLRRSLETWTLEKKERMEGHHLTRRLLVQ